MRKASPSKLTQTTRARGARKRGREARGGCRARGSTRAAGWTRAAGPRGRRASCDPPSEVAWGAAERLPFRLKRHWTRWHRKLPRLSRAATAGFPACGFFGAKEMQMGNFGEFIRNSSKIPQKFSENSHLHFLARLLEFDRAYAIQAERFCDGTPLPPQRNF